MSPSLERRSIGRLLNSVSLIVSSGGKVWFDIGAFERQQQQIIGLNGGTNGKRTIDHNYAKLPDRCKIEVPNVKVDRSRVKRLQRPISVLMSYI